MLMGHVRFLMRISMLPMNVVARRRKYGLWKRCNVNETPTGDIPGRNNDSFKVIIRVLPGCYILINYFYQYMEEIAMNTYKIKALVKGSEEDADGLRKYLAQTIYDEFELGGVYGVSIELETPLQYKYVLALCMVELETGLTKAQIDKVLAMLPDEGDYMPIEFHENNTSAYGFVSSEYYQQHDYKPHFLSGIVTPILCDMKLESANGVYNTPDGRSFFMGYFQVQENQKKY